MLDGYVRARDEFLADAQMDPCRLHHDTLSRRLLYAIALYAFAPNSWQDAPYLPRLGTREDCYELAVGYAVLYQRYVQATDCRTNAKRALKNWEYVAYAEADKVTLVSKDDWLTQVDAVLTEARRRFGAELRAARRPESLVTGRRGA